MRATSNALMPHIPSSAELGFMGSMARSAPDGAAPHTNWGRNGDTEVVHAARGEMMVPPEVLQQYPEVGQIIAQALSSMGADPNRYVVGSSRSSINPHTGQPEFFFKAIKNALKKISSSALGRIAIPVLASIALPGIGTAIGANISGAVAAGIGSAAATKLSGGSWGQAIGAGLGSYVGGNIGVGGISGSVGSGLTSAGLGGVANMLPGAIANAGLSSIAGSWLGSNLGETIGGMIDPPKVKLPSTSWGNEIANSPSLMTPSLPDGSLEAAIPDQQSDVPTTKGSGVNPNVPATSGVNYLTTVKDRDTGQNRTINSTFGSNFDNSRRSSWGSGVSFV